MEKNTTITQREQFKLNMIKPEDFPPCNDITHLIGQLRGAGFQVVGKVLDCGCGHGRLGRYLVQLNGIEHVLGVDINPNAIKIAQDRAPQRALSRIDFQCEDIMPHLKEHRKRYHIISAFNILDHVKNPAKLVNAMMSHLRKDGFLIGSVPLGPLSAHGIGAWESLEDFKEQFPKLTIVEMDKPDIQCIVFMFKKVR